MSIPFIDHVPPGWKKYEMQCGRVFVGRENCCLFCRHCCDIFYDSGGIYMIMCDISEDVETKGIQGLCEKFDKTEDDKDDHKR